MLTTQSLRYRLPETSISVVYLDDWKNIDRYPTSAHVSLATPTNLVHVIYTAGSAGEPKGVLIEHAGLANLAYQHRNLYGDREEIRISQIANVCVGSMDSEIWPALLSGASLCIAPNGVRADPRRVAALADQAKDCHRPLRQLLLLSCCWRCPGPITGGSPRGTPVTRDRPAGPARCRQPPTISSSCSSPPTERQLTPALVPTQVNGS